MKDPILIVGCARSGTSMTAGMLNICGAFGGDMFGPHPNNQKGMFENKELRTNIVRPYLEKIGCDPKGQFPLPNKRQVFEVSPAEITEWRFRVKEAFVKQGYVDINQPWFYKCPKSCHIWYLWHMAFPKAKWIIVNRKHEDIIRSCQKTSFLRNAFRNSDGWLNWINTHEQRFKEIRKCGLDFVDFWPTRMIEGDFAYAKNLVENLGLTWKEKLVRAFIEPKMFIGN
jgi:hypothetical protein